MWRAIPRRLTTPSLFYTRLWWLGNRRVLPPPAWSRKNLSGHADSFPKLPSFLKLQVGNPAGAIVGAVSKHIQVFLLEGQIREAPRSWPSNRRLRDVIARREKQESAKAFAGTTGVRSVLKKRLDKRGRMGQALAHFRSKRILRNCVRLPSRGKPGFP